MKHLYQIQKATNARSGNGKANMKTSKLIAFALATILTASVALASFTKPVEEKDIVDTAVSAGSFKTLVAAVKAAGLVDALKGEGPLTVFAPTDAAFAKLEKQKPGITAMLLKPENKAKLTAILTYHAISGKVLAADVVKLKDGTHVKTLSGKSIKISNKHGVKINTSKVIKTDIMCTNGVIHVIDTVLLPK
jgi:uncharacterized surface protein with fasciclin (FAS1) repeats